MTKAFSQLMLITALFAGGAGAQSYPLMAAAVNAPPAVAVLPADRNAPVLAPPRALPRMAPELALETYLARAQRQMAQLGSYSDETVIEADLPSTRQRGRLQVRRTFSAPKSLAFTAVGFVGDNFVKSNVIVRLLQSEVDHVEKGEGAQTAINAGNYKFKFKSEEQLDGKLVYAYEVKPRRKRPGLFKGRIYVDAYSGSLRRAEGAMVKSPSFFIKKIEFVQDYADVEGFSLPVRLHSVSRTRLVGSAIVDITHSNYQARSLAQLEPQSPPAVPGSN